MRPSIRVKVRVDAFLAQLEREEQQEREAEAEKNFQYYLDMEAGMFDYHSQWDDCKCELCCAVTAERYMS